MTLSVKEVFGNEIEERIEELMREGKESPIRGWSAREISNTIEEEFSDEYAGDYAWSYILKQCGHSPLMEMNDE